MKIKNEDQRMVWTRLEDACPMQKKKKKAQSTSSTVISSLISQFLTHKKLRNTNFYA